MPPHRTWTATLGPVVAATILGIASPAAPAGAAATPAVAQTSPATAQRGDVERLGLEATAGFDGRFITGTWVPVTVSLAPDRLVAGVLDVDVRLDNGGRLTETRPFEVAGGSRKRFRVVVPPLADLTVTVRPDGEEPVRVRPSTQQRVAGGAFLVGVLGEVPTDPPAVESVATRRRAVYVSVDPEWLALSAHALDSVGTLVAHTQDLQRLPDAARRTLAAAVAGGVDLTVVADRPGPVDLGLTSPATARGEDGTLTAEPGAWVLTEADLSGPPTHRTDTAAGVGRVIAAAAPLGR
ncbi:MAG: hypothetical protein M3N57_06885, partial [Actinomycetota bacterium]|nr:hypothetical protein [Actinomycetota bacterium]